MLENFYVDLLLHKWMLQPIAIFQILMFIVGFVTFEA